VPGPRKSPELAKEDLPRTSSFPSADPPEQVALFRDVLRVLEDCRVPYVVSGAFALRHHTGICRATKDLDLFLTADNCSLALDCLNEAGFECEISDPIWLAKAHRDGYFVDLISGMSNGLISVEDSWIARSHPAVVYGVETRVLAAEELVASKLFVARRERFDGADVAHILFGTYGAFDWQRELDLIGEHWEMLLWALVLFRYVYPGQSHYVPVQIWQELLGRFEHQLQHRDPRADFRGTLIDDNMFAIDVNEWGLTDLLEQRRKCCQSPIRTDVAAEKESA